jgi:hypothetical protein
MKILNSILAYDLHKKKGEDQGVPMMLEIPAKNNFIPSIVSSTELGRFLVSTKLTGSSMIRTGLFSSNITDLDKTIYPLFNMAYDLCKRENFQNIFSNPKDSFNYIRKSSGLKNQPHCVLIPSSMKNVNKIFGKENIIEKNYSSFYNDVCKIVHCKIGKIIFLSNPEYVGMHTRFSSGSSSIILHNLRLGISFCDILWIL